MESKKKKKKKKKDARAFFSGKTASSDLCSVRKYLFSFASLGAHAKGQLQIFLLVDTSSTTVIAVKYILVMQNKQYGNMEILHYNLSL